MVENSIGASPNPFSIKTKARSVFKNSHIAIGVVVLFLVVLLGIVLKFFRRYFLPGGRLANEFEKS